MDIQNKISFVKDENLGTIIPNNDENNEKSFHNNCDMVIGEYKKRIEELEKNIKRREVETKKARFRLEPMKGWEVWLGIFIIIH